MASENDIYSPGAAGGSINWAAVAQQEKKNKKPEQKGNFLTNLLPTGGGIGGALAGGAAGAALGSVVPVVGTGIGGLIGAILGGAGGSALGKVGENAAEGEADLGKGVAQEALFGGITSTPLTAGLKVAKGGIQLAKATATGGAKTAAKQSFQEAGQLAIPKMATGLQGKAGQEIADTAIQRGAMSPGVLGRIQNTGLNLKRDVAGTSKVADSFGQETDIVDTLRRNGISGSAANQYKQVDTALGNLSKSIDDELSVITRTVPRGDTLKSIKTRAIDALPDDPTFVKEVDRSISRLDKSGSGDISARELFRFKQDLGNRLSPAFRKLDRGAPLTTKEEAEMVLWRSIDDDITKIAPSVKDMTLDQSRLISARPGLQKSSEKAFGIPILGIKSKAVNRGIQSVQDRLGDAALGGPGVLSRAKRIKGEAVVPPEVADAFGPPVRTTGQGVLGTVARESGLGTRQSLTGIGQPVNDGSILPSEDGDPGSYQLDSPVDAQDNDPFSESNIKNLIQQDLQGNGGKNIANLLKLYETFNSGSSKKELTSSQATRAAAAQNALKDIPLLEDAIASGKLGAAKGIPGAGTAVGRRLLGTENLDAALFNIADNILRARSGAAAPEAEVKRFVDTFLPGAFDSEEAKQLKLERAVRELNGYVNPAAASQGADLQELAAGL